MLKARLVIGLALLAGHLVRAADNNCNCPGANGCANCSSCCRTITMGFSQCCGPKQQCCRAYDSFCCDAETEVCGQKWQVCLPKHQITGNPRAGPGQLEWAANLTSPWNVYPPVVVNDSFVAASGGLGTALVRLRDGAVTYVLPQSQMPLAVAGGHVIAATYGQLVSYDAVLGSPSWTLPYNGFFMDLVGHRHYLLAISYEPSELNVYDARNGSLLYSIPYAFGVRSPVVSPYGTVAFAHGESFVIFELGTGTILTNVSATIPCPLLPPPLLVGSVFVSCNFVAYSAQTGLQLWALGAPPSISFFATTTTAIVGASQEHLYFVARSDGAPINKVPCDTCFALLGAGSEVLLTDDNLTAYNGSNGELLWTQADSEYQFEEAMGVARLGYAYIPASSRVYPNALVAVDVRSGQFVHSWGAGGFVASPILVAERVLFMAYDGFLYCVNLLGSFD